MTHPNHHETFPIPKEQDKKESGHSVSSLILQLHQAITDSQNTPRTLQAHCQALPAAQVIEEPFYRACQRAYNPRPR